MSRYSFYELLITILIPDRVTYFKLIHLFKVRHHRAPSYLRTRFSSVSDSHSHFTRGSHVNLRVSSTFSQVQGSFAYSCVRQWNALPNRIKEIDSLLSFKRALRSYLLDRYNWISFSGIGMLFISPAPIYMLRHIIFDWVNFTRTLLEISPRTFTGYPWFWLYNHCLYCASNQNKFNSINSMGLELDDI